MDYSIIKSLGQGYFGKVVLGKKDNGDEVAIKIQHQGNTYQEKHRFRQEAEIMIRLDHSFIIKAYSFDYIDNKSIIVMEYIKGKNLYDILKKFIICPFDLARFYMAEIGVGLDYLHKNKILYRDLKPDNVVVGLNGHIKITDFGLSKILITDKTKGFSICGTLEYIAPEILNNTGYRFESDWWSYAVMTYELVTGIVPIKIESTQTIKKNLENPAVFLHPLLPRTIKDFIKKTLILDPVSRPKFDQIKKMEWFRGIDWVLLEELKIKPPIDIFNIYRNNKKLIKS